ncbi:MAG: deoxyhypusine synthase family protein, partial [Halobacteriota archaeon]
MDAEDTRENVVPGTEEDVDAPAVRGYDYRGDVTLDDLLDSYATTGFQATHLARAVDILRRMRDEDVAVYLSFTSNIASSGLREAIAYLVREGHVDVVITTSGAVAEDVIKTEHPFVLGRWDADEAELRERGINRLGNIYVPSDRYVWLEEYLYDFYDDFFEEDHLRTPREFTREVGERLDDSDSFLAAAADHDVPVYVPGFT